MSCLDTEPHEPTDAEDSQADRTSSSSPEIELEMIEQPSDPSSRNMSLDLAVSASNDSVTDTDADLASLSKFSKFLSVFLTLVTSFVSIGILVVVFCLFLDVVLQDKVSIQCQAQAFAELSTKWLVTDASSTATRLASMYARGSFDSPTAFSASG